MTSLDAATITVPDLAAPVELLARVLGVGFADLVSRMVNDGLDAALADPDVRAAYDALARLDNRRNNAPANDDRPGVEAVGRPGLCVHAEAEHSRTDGERDRRAPVGAERDTRSPAKPRSDQHRQVASSESPRVDQLSPTERHDIGHAVREKRIARGLSQRQVAAELGISAVALGYVEAGTKKASAKLVAACDAWATKPHRCDAQPHVATRKLPGTSIPVPSDDVPDRSTFTNPGPTPKLGRAKYRAPIEREPKVTPPTPIPDGMKLWDCQPYRSRITEAACGKNKALAKSDDPKAESRERCITCPGVVALAKRSAA
jgi:hypothetical protein